jgi:hypothetical protein
MAAEYCERQPHCERIMQLTPTSASSTRIDESQPSSILGIYPVDHPTSHTEVTTYGDEYVS